jgi:WD40 repeat protein
MNRSIRCPTGLQGSPSGSPLYRDTTDFEPIPVAAEAGRRRTRIGSSRWPWWGRRRLGLLFLGLIVLPWLPLFGPPNDAMPARRARGFGDGHIVAFAFAADGETIATIQMDGPVAMRGVAREGSRHSFLDYRGQAWALASSPDGRSVVVGGSEPDIRLYDVRTSGVGHPLGIPIRWARCLAFSPDGSLLAASSVFDHEILLWDFTSGRERARLRGHESSVTSLAFAPDGRSLVSASAREPAIFFWDLATGRPRRLGVPHGSVTALAYSPDGGWLASTSPLEGPVRLWDLAGGRGDRLIGTHSQARDPVAFSPDGRMLATAGDDGAVWLWDLATGARLRRLGDRGDRLTGVAFSPDGRTLAAVGTGSDIRLWDLGEVLKSETER